LHVLSPLDGKTAETQAHFSPFPKHSRQKENIDQSFSELLQHEIDLLDGILAVDRGESIPRVDYEKNKAFYDSQVDFAIIPTL